MKTACRAADMHILLCQPTLVLEFTSTFCSWLGQHSCRLLLSAAVGTSTICYCLSFSCSCIYKFGYCNILESSLAIVFAKYLCRLSNFSSSSLKEILTGSKVESTVSRSLLVTHLHSEGWSTTSWLSSLLDQDYLIMHQQALLTSALSQCCLLHFKHLSAPASCLAQGQMSYIKLFYFGILTSLGLH